MRSSPSSYSNSSYSNSSFASPFLRLRIGPSIYVLFLLAVACLWMGQAAPSAAQSAPHDDDAQAQIEAAWALAATADQYQFRTRLEQLIYPEPSIRNAGRQPEKDLMGLEGAIDGDQSRIEATIWADASFDPNRGIDLLMENGRSYLREANHTEWTEIDDFSQSVAPAGDPLSFLAGIRAVQAAGRDDLMIGQVTVPLTRYTFELDGPELGRHVDRLQAQMLLEAGEVPNGFSMEGHSYFHDATGFGTIWIDQNGYPARMVVDLGFLLEEGGEKVEAQIQTDLYEFERGETAVLPDFGTAPREWLAQTAAEIVTPQNGVTFGWSLLLGLTLVLLAIFMWRYAHTKEFYTTMASLVIIGLLLPPLLQAQEARAYYDHLIDRSEEQAGRDATIEQHTDIHEATYGDSWQPHIDPYAEGRALKEAHDLLVAETAVLTSNSETDIDLDSDGDGATDEEETLWDSCPYLLSDTTNFDNEEDCDGVTDPNDSDGDGLTDYTEIYELGTMPGEVDSDGDTIIDSLEVNGFSYRGETWYLNPIADDTNNDGRSDGLECFVWSFNNEDQDTGAICPDSDNDGTPDAYDHDDDGDEVLDRDDEDPSSVSDLFDRDNPMMLSLSGVEIDRPVLVNIQMRPEDDSLLTASGLVLDWPTGDYDGQITRGNDTTFATTTNQDAYSTDENASYGDIKVTPMLRIRAPYTTGHYANLPVNDTYYGVDRTIGITVGQWLDTAELDALAITVSDADETSGDIEMYVPLTTVYSDIGENAVGFYATTFYSPTQGTNGVAEWGNAHEYSLVWLVQMITDSCDEEDWDADGIVNDDDSDIDGDGLSNIYDNVLADCTRVDELTTIQMYEEEWRATGLTVSEEHGLSAAVMYEDPTQDDDLGLDDQLWLAGWNLGNVFTSGLDCDSTDTANNCIGDGTRDLTIDGIEAELDVWGTTDGINYNDIAFEGVDHYIHEDYLSLVAISTTATILDNTFLSYTDSQAYTSLLIAYETTQRSMGLTESTGLGSEIVLDFDALESQTTAAVFLQTYSYDAAAGWEAADEASYLEYLSDTLQDTDTFFQLEDDSEEAEEELEGKLLWAQNYYISLMTGSVGVVAVDGAAFNAVDFSDSDDPDSFFEYLEFSFFVLSEAGQTSAASRLSYVVSHYLKGVLNKQTHSYRFWGYISEMYSISDLGVASNSLNGTDRYFHNKAYKKYKLFDNKFLTRIVKGNALKMVAVTLGLFLIGAFVLLSGLITTLAGESEVGDILIKIGLAIAALASILILALEQLAVLAKFDYLRKLKIGIRGNVGKVLTSYGKQYRVHAVWGAAIGIGVSVAVFLYTWSSIGWSTSNPYVDQAAAYLIGTIIFELLFAFLIFLFPIGTAIALLIELVDAILFLLTILIDGFDFTISAWIAEVIGDLMYSVNFTAANADDDDRVQTVGDSGLLDSALGYVESNTMVFTMTVVNTLYTTESRDDLKRNSFQHALDVTGNSLNNVTLGDGDMADEWINTDSGEFWAEGVGDIKYSTSKGVYSTTQFVINLPFSYSGTGINQNTQTPYFSEAYYLLAEGCWHVFAIAGTEYGCKEIDYTGVGVSELDPFTFDVLPDSLVDFIQLDWNNGKLSFPEQQDQDGDGEAPLTLGGTDPDDTTQDSDGDGLSDYYEITNGYEANDADADDDGLTDWEELFIYYTDPTNGDYDEDGLGDYIEAKVGWLVAYTDENGVEQATRVWSDPYTADLDDDGIGDLEEYIYGFNPAAVSDLSAVDSFIDFGDLSLEEEGVPFIFLDLEETAGSTEITDRSGEGHDFSCDEASGTCPAMETSGAYNTGMTFDGVDDVLTQDDLNIELDEFTIAAWVYNDSTATGYQPIFGSSSGFTADSPPSIAIFDTSDIVVGFGDGTSWNSISPFHTFINTDQWQHVAATYDGDQLRIYVNAVGVYNEPTYAGAIPADITEIVLGRNGSDYFQGGLDEVFFYDRALDIDGISALKARKYNLGDLIFDTEGGELSYGLTVSNTTAAVNTDGYLHAATELLDPAFPQPDFYLSFDDEHTWATFDNSFNTDSDAYCLAYGDTCPTNETTITAVGTSLEFDGVDDVVYLPSLTSSSTDGAQGGLFFWLFVENYPSASTTATIIDTESEEDGATDLYLDAAGGLYLDAAGYSSIQITSTFPISDWVHIGYQRGYVYINGEQTAYSGSHVQYPKFGHGTLGADLNGENVLDGAVDEIVVYHESISASKIQNKVMEGKYNFGGQKAHALLKFEDQIDTDDTVFSDPSQYSNHAYCDDANTCPSEVTGRDGTGTAVSFDGVDDYLVQPDTLNVFDQYYTYDGEITFYIYPTAYPADGEIAQIYESESTSGFGAYLDDSGRMAIREPYGTYSVLKTAIPLNEWTKVKLDFYYDEVDISDINQQRMWRYLNGSYEMDFVGNAARSYMVFCTDCDSDDDDGFFVGNGRIGNSLDGTAPFEGRIDDFNIEIAEHDFDRYERTLNYYDPVNDLIRTECDMLEDCVGNYPGKFGQASDYGGTEKVDFLEQLDFARGDYSVGFWFYADHYLNQTLFSAYDDAGEKGVQIDLLGTGYISYSHSFPTGSTVTQIQSSETFTRSNWHHLLAVKDVDTMSLYLDGTLVASQSGVTGTADENLNVTIGDSYDGSNRWFYGYLDEMAIFSEAATQEHATFLSQTRYPALDIPVPYETFSLDSGETKTISGVATVNNTVGASTFGFKQEVEVAIDLETELSYTTYENTDGVWSGYFRFEEVPGDESYENLVGYGSEGTAAEIDGTCQGDRCPVGGVRGIDGRAAFFDGDDDYFFADIDSVDNTAEPEVRSLSVWVKGSDGTIFDSAGPDRNGGFQLTMGTLINGDADQFEFDMPRNEWTHVAATIDATDVMTLYINASVVLTGVEQTTDTRSWVVGANYGPQNHFLGYIDELKIFATELTAADINDLYQNIGAEFRFEFDEESGETNFVDSLSDYVGEPVTLECADLTLYSLTGANFDALLTNLLLELDGDSLLYDATAVYDNTTADLNISTTLCGADQSLTATGVYSDGTEISFASAQTISVAQTGMVTATMSYNGQQLTLVYGVATAAQQTSPIVGTDGRIGNTAYFTGEDNGHIEVTPAGIGDFSNASFTLMGWIKTDETGVGLLTKSDSDTNWESGERSLYVSDEGTLAFQAYGDGQIDSTEQITDSNWHHFAVVWDDANGNGTILVDGLDVTDVSTNYAPTTSDNAADTLKFGAPNYDQASGYFVGQLDEIILYTGRAFTTNEVFDTYQQEARWYRDSAEFVVTIDDDDPTIEVESDYGYRADGYIQLVVTADDATSGIAYAQYKHRKSGSGYSDWADMSICADAAATVYCPSFTTDGEGVYEVLFRVYDGIGRITETDEPFYIYVDTTPPWMTGTPDHNNEYLGNTVSELSDDTWQISFAGWIFDDDITGEVAGSGIYTPGIGLNVYNENGTRVGSANQPVTVTESGADWYMDWDGDYLISGEPIAGLYTVTLTAEDTLGNSHTETLGNFFVDEQAPMIETAVDLIADAKITRTNTITGVIIDQAIYHQPMLDFYFEETATGRSFYDYGQLGFHVDCTANCPQTTESGVFGRALSFNGIDQDGFVVSTYPISDVVNFDAADPFVISLWVQADTPQVALGSTTHSLVEKWDGAGAYPYAIRYHNQTSDDYGRISASVSDGTTMFEITSTVTITDGAFHHVALVNDGESYQLYIDGRSDIGMTIAASGSVTNTADVALGHRPGDGNSLFAGAIDQFAIYDKALTAEQIYAIAQTDVSGVGSVGISMEVIDFDNYPDNLLIEGREGDVSWSSADLDQANGLGSAWTYTMSDVQNFYYIHMRGADGDGHTQDAATVWKGLIDHTAPLVTFTGEQAYGGSYATSTYDFTVSDFILDQSTLVHPCGEDDLTILTYDDISVDAPHYGLAYEMSGSCTLAGHVVSETVSVCDAAEHCTRETVDFGTDDGLNTIFINTPANNTVFTTTHPITISGELFSKTPTFTVDISIDYQLFDTLIFTSGVTETTWSTVWDVTGVESYRIDAVLTDDNGETGSDSHNFSVEGSCFVDYNGDDVTDFATTDSTAVRDGLAAAASGATVRVAGTCAGTVELANPEYVAYIDQPVTLEGGYDASDWAAGSDPANTPTLLDASGTGRVLHVADGTDVTIRNISLVNGDAEAYSEFGVDPEDYGGGIYLIEGDNFLLDNVTVSNNTANLLGGGLYVVTGTVTISDSLFSQNAAVQYGGGLYVVTGTVTIESSQFIDNEVNYVYGGGLYGDNLIVRRSTIADNKGNGIYVHGSLTLEDSTIQNNTTAVGAGIYLAGAAATIDRSTIRDNTTNISDGGGLYNDGGSFDITNSTISGNTAGNSSDGGGIYNNGGSGTLTHVSVISNTAAGSGGGLYNGSGNIDLYYSIIAYSPNGNDCAGTITDQKRNIASDNSCGLTHNQSLNNTDPLLEPLADNGGETATHALQKESPAVSLANGSDQTEDQRGVARPQFAAADSGAYEFDYVYTADNCTVSPWVISDTIDLNQAITCFNAETAASATIEFAQGFTLIEETISISNSVSALTIDGQGMTLDANDDYRHFHIEAGMVTITDVTLKDGRSPIADLNGGAIRIESAGDLLVDGVTFESNQTVENGSGGSIYNEGDAVITNSYFYWDTASDTGGSVANAGTLTFDKSTVFYSEANFGGGFANMATGVLTVTNSTFGETYAYNSGGMIYNDGGLVNLIHASIIDGSAEGESGSDLAVVHNDSGVLTVTLSILTKLDGDICVGTITDGGGNIAGDSSCGFTAATSANSTDPQVGSLADNGGATQTYGISSSSPAVDVAACVLTEDQRGEARPSGVYCDSGSVEFQYTTIPVSQTLTYDETGDLTIDWDTDPGATGCQADLYRNTSPYTGHVEWQSDLTSWTISDAAAGDENSYYFVWLLCDGDEAAIMFI